MMTSVTSSEENMYTGSLSETNRIQARHDDSGVFLDELTYRSM